LYPVTDNGTGLVAEFEDTEGNRIALFQTKWHLTKYNH
jgi:predicted enzyme related to lactoylglutathione lyase